MPPASGCREGIRHGRGQDNVKRLLEIVVPRIWTVWHYEVMLHDCSPYLSAFEQNPWDAVGNQQQRQVVCCGGSYEDQQPEVDGKCSFGCGPGEKCELQRFPQGSNVVRRREQSLKP